MSKISSTTYHNKLLLKIGLTAMAGLMGQAALAACPEVQNLRELIPLEQNPPINGSTIYFCKTTSYLPPSASDSRLKFKVEQEDLITGGSQAISQSKTNSSDTIQGFPSNPKIDLGSFDLSATNLKPGTLIAGFPSRTADTSHLFNFYTRKSINYGNPSLAQSQAACGNPKLGEYKIIEEHLKLYPSIFDISPASTSFDRNPNKGFLKFSGVKLESTIVPSSNLTADLYLYHMNNRAGQFFTRDDGLFRSYVYCWYGVRAELEIKPNDSGANIQHAGEYILNIGVNTQ